MSILVTGLIPFQNASAQFQQGGVDHPGEWYVGEGLKQGDFFSYQLCHVDYKECADFQMDFWIEGDTKVGSEDKWLAHAVVYDGNKIVKGTMELGKVAPEPTGGSNELSLYRGAFKTSIVWLSAFATSYGGDGGEGPKEFSKPSWGKIGNIGGEQIIPTAIEPVSTRGGYFDESVLVSWKTGGAKSQVWVVDGFPFPVKASTWTHVSEGIPPQEYKFELLDYQENVSTNPFSGIVSTAEEQSALGCPSIDSLDTSVKKPTNNFAYQVHIFHSPEEPIQGCPMSWLVKFISKYDDTEFLNQVQYDLLVVDDNLTPLRSIAQDEGRLYLYSPSGQAQIDMIVDEPVGDANYVIWIYGLSPEGIVPSTAPDYVKLTLPVQAIEGSSVITPPKPTPTPAPTPTPMPTTDVAIPGWIKTNAGWWADGQIDNNSFVQGIQFLIKEGIMVIPATSQGVGSGSNDIPDWIKQNAKWWADGQIDDNSFVQGIQFLIKEGIIRIA